MEAVFSLKSVREFSPQAVPEPLVRDILKEVMRMPVTGPQRPWQFVVINDRSLLERIPDFLSSAHLVREAPLAVVVCYDSRLGEHKEVWFRDCTTAAETILVVARARNLGLSSFVSAGNRAAAIQVVLGEGVHSVRCTLTPTRNGLAYAGSARGRAIVRKPGGSAARAARTRCVGVRTGERRARRTGA